MEGRAKALKKNKKEFHDKVKSLQDRVASRGDGSKISKKKATGMVHAHEIKELKLKVVKAALLLYRSGTLLSPADDGKNSGTAKGKTKGRKTGKKDAPEDDKRGVAPVCECRVCWRGFGNAVDLQKHVCVVNSAGETSNSRRLFHLVVTNDFAHLNNM